MSRSEQTRKTVAALIMGGYAGGVQSLVNGVPAAQAAERKREARAMLAALAPAAGPLADDELAEMLLDNELDYYGSGAVEPLIAEIKRLRGPALVPCADDESHNPHDYTAGIAARCPGLAGEVGS